jgi:hypothetical protein
MTALDIFQKVARHELTPEEGADLLMPRRKWYDHANFVIGLVVVALLLLWEAWRP